MFKINKFPLFIFLFLPIAAYASSGGGGTPVTTLTGEATGSGNGTIATTIGTSAVTSKPLTGFSAGAGSVSATDTILTAFNKIVGNINGIVSGVSSVFGRTGVVTAQSGDYSVSQITGAAPLASPTFTGSVVGTSATWSGNDTAAAFVPTGTAIPSSGIYAPATNAVAIAAGSSSVATFAADGGISLGTSLSDMGAATINVAGLYVNGGAIPIMQGGTGGTTQYTALHGLGIVPRNCIDTDGTNLFLTQHVATQNGSSYTATKADGCAQLNFTAATAVTLGTSTTNNFGSGYGVGLYNASSAIMSVTAGASNLAGLSTLYMAPGDSCELNADGTNYKASACTPLSRLKGINVGTSYASVLPPTNGAIIQGNVGIGTATPTQSLTLNGSLNFNTTSSQGIIGTTTNDNAAAGQVGEYVTSFISSGSAVSLTTGTAANVTSISLTAGDWDVGGNIATFPAGTTVQTYLLSSVSTTSATHNFINGSLIQNQYTAATGGQEQSSLGTVRLSLASTTTVYLVATSNFSVSTNAAFGTIWARRRR